MAYRGLKQAISCHCSGGKVGSVSSRFGEDFVNPDRAKSGSRSALVLIRED